MRTYEQKIRDKRLLRWAFMTFVLLGLALFVTYGILEVNKQVKNHRQPKAEFVNSISGVKIPESRFSFLIYSYREAYGFMSAVPKGKQYKLVDKFKLDQGLKVGIQQELKVLRVLKELKDWKEKKGFWDERILAKVYIGENNARIYIFEEKEGGE